MDQANHKEIGIRSGEENCVTGSIDFKNANSLVHFAISTVVETITSNSLINLDAADVGLVLLNSKEVTIGTAKASGANRARCAVGIALTSIRQQGVCMDKIHRGLINITATHSLLFNEVWDVLDCVKLNFAKGSVIVTGTAENEAMEDDIRVTVFAIN